MTLVPWAVGRQLLWVVTVFDSFALRRINPGSVCNPGTSLAEAEDQNSDKCRDLINDGYIFQPIVLKFRVPSDLARRLLIRNFVRTCARVPRNPGQAFF